MFILLNFYFPVFTVVCSLRLSVFRFGENVAPKINFFLSLFLLTAFLYFVIITS